MIFLKYAILLHKYTNIPLKIGKIIVILGTSGLTYTPHPIFKGTQILMQICIDPDNGQNQSQKCGNPHFSGKVACLWFLSNLAHRKLLHRSFKRIKKKNPNKIIISNILRECLTNKNILFIV